MKMSETELKKALAKANQHIEQLCSTVNTLAGFRKVRVEDFRVNLESAWSAPDFPRAVTSPK
jgi:hypothetical protein